MRSLCSPKTKSFCHKPSKKKFKSLLKCPRGTPSCLKMNYDRSFWMIPPKVTTVTYSINHSTNSLRKRPLLECRSIDLIPFRYEQRSLRNRTVSSDPHICNTFVTLSGLLLIEQEVLIDNSKYWHTNGQSKYWHFNETYTGYRVSYQWLPRCSYWKTKWTCFEDVTRIYETKDTTLTIMTKPKRHIFVIYFALNDGHNMEVLTYEWTQYKYWHTNGHNSNTDVPMDTTYILACQWTQH